MNEIATVNTQFESMMQTGFSPEEQAYFDYADPMQAYMHTLGEQNLQFGTLSADDPYTSQALREPQAVEVLLSHNRAVGALGSAAMNETFLWQQLMLVIQAEHNRKLLDDEDDSGDGRPARPVLAGSRLVYSAN